MKKCICKTFNQKGDKGMGIFVKIPYEKELIPTLITNLKFPINQEINIELNKNIFELYQKKIIVDNKRKKLINNSYNINIIEINADKDKIHNFIELDENIVDLIIKTNNDKNNIKSSINNKIINNKNNKTFNEYNNEIIYSIQNYNEENNDFNINYEQFNLNNKNKYNSFSPLILLKNNKLIEIEQKEKNNNILIINLIQDFYEQIKIFKKNLLKRNQSLKIEQKPDLNLKKEESEELEEKLITIGTNNLTIIYNIPKYSDGKIKLFGQIFVKENINNFDILIDEEKHELLEYYTLTKEQKSKEELKINLIEKEPASTLKYMFHNCNLLKDLPDINQFNTKNITDMSYMFSNCSSLISLPDISKLNTENVKTMKSMFNFCSSLNSLSDISFWNTGKVTDMSNLFANCKSLRQLPNLAKWNTSNVLNTSYMFEDCTSLQYLPDLSQWNVRSLVSISGMFKNCTALRSFPDISKWNFMNIKYKEEVFKGVSKKILPKKLNCLIF